MRTIIWLVLLFVVAVVAALTLGDNDGLASFTGRAGGSTCRSIFSC